MELKPHQRKAVEELDNGKILFGGTGSGKTIASLAYFFERVCGGVVGDMGSLKTPTNLYVITTAKKRDDLDWDKEALKFGIGKDPECSAGGIALHVDSWNNIKEYKDVKGAFFIFDEQRLVGSGAWTQSFLEIAKHNGWILLSATPGDNWLDYIPVFLANGFYKNRTQFKREHVVYSHYSKFPKVERYVGQGKLRKLRQSIIVHMPYEKHTVRHVSEVIVDYNIDQFERVVKKRWNVFENKPLKDVAELFRVMRKVVNSDESRLEAISTLMQSHPRLIVFYNFDYELEMLRTLQEPSTSSSSNTSSSSKPQSSMSSTGEQPTPDSQSADQSGHTEQETQHATEASIGGTSGRPSFAIAEWNGHKHQPIPDTESWVYLVQYVAGSEGWNCTTTDATVFYSLTYSYKNWFQAFGRIDRMNTKYKHLYYYVLLSKSQIDRAIMSNLKQKKNFNENDYVKKTEWERAA